MWRTETSLPLFDTHFPWYKMRALEEMVPSPYSHASFCCCVPLGVGMARVPGH